MGEAKCPTCSGHGIVATRWPSGYPHATPCPICRPNDPCECKAKNCPSADAVAAWKAAQATDTTAPGADGGKGGER